MPAGKGQVLMTGVKGEQYPIPTEYFEQHYLEDVKPGWCYKKKVVVDAEVLEVETSVKVSWCEALLTGKPGDYLVTYEPGNQAIVEKNIFEETYEVIPQTFKAVLSGFKTKEQAQNWLRWYEGCGEQDEGIGIVMGNENISVLTDVMTGMIEHPDGFEYKVKIYEGDEEL